MNSVSVSDRPFVSAPTTARMIVSVLGIQAGWFAGVLGAAHGLLWAGTTLAAAIVVLNIGHAARPLQELILLTPLPAMNALSLGWAPFTPLMAFHARRFSSIAAEG